jgi:predicted nucleic acid-binding protein
MKPVFADTGFFLALVNPRDQYHGSSTFVVMEREGLTEALTADRHFEQAGFRALLRG